MSVAEVLEVYRGSNADATRALYARLEQEHGGLGVIAVNLLRAQKASERAKVYRGGGYRGAAYDKKQWAMGELCKALQQFGALYKIGWGWGLDEATPGFPHVLYVDLSTGQVSFHSPSRGEGPHYEGIWDGVPGQSADRVVRWAGRVLEGRAVA